MLPANKEGFFPYTPATNLLYGLAEAMDMLHEEGLDRVFARHDRHAEGTRRAVRAWGLEILCRDPKYYSSVLTAVLMPEGHNADDLRKTALDALRYFAGHGSRQGGRKVFRIGHLGDTNDLTILPRWPAWKWALPWPTCRTSRAVCAAAMDYFTQAAKVGRT